VIVACCPVCRKELKAPETVLVTGALAKTVVPFCSGRCKQIDLNKWLSEEYRVPTGEEETEETGEGYDA